MKEDQASVTSLVIACAVLVLGGDEYGRSRLPPGCLQAQISLLGAAQLFFGKFPWLLSNPVLAKLMRWTLLFVQPQLLESIAFRKTWLEHQTRQAITSGITQVLVLANGYDTLAYRLSNEFGHVTFWTVDHPATSKVFERGLEQLKQRPQNLHTLAIDLTHSKLQDLLTKMIYYSPTASTMVIMEGLSFYLSSVELQNLFEDIRHVVGVGSRVGFDFFEPNQHNQPNMGPLSGFVQLLLKTIKEPMKWSIRKEELSSFFADTNWKVVTPVASMGIERLAAVQLMEK